MGWGGKIGLGAIGAMFGGPIGAIIGASIGHLLDSSSTGRVSTSRFSLQQQKQVAYFTCFFTCLAKMAKADGVVTRDEIASVEKLMTQLRLEGEAKEFAVAVFREAKDSNEPIDGYLTQFGDIVGWDVEACTTLAFSLALVAMADGVLHSKEEELLTLCEKLLRLPAGKTKSFFNSSSQPSNLEDAYAILGCKASDSLDDIKTAYRRKCLEYHPDKIQSKGLPSEFIQFANQQLVKFNEAYDRIKKVRG